MDNTKDSEISQWNKERKGLLAALEKSNKQLYDIYERKMTLITRSEDEVSRTLNVLFDKASEHTSQEFIKAQERKERGNPPGKSTDPLGDQINWEQLLNSLNLIDELYIISNDHDLLTTIDNKSFLSPFLHEEIKQVNKNLKVNCFHSLSNALIALTKTSSEKIENLPSQEILEEINSKEENDFQHKSYTIYYGDYDPRSEELQRLKYMYSHAMITTDTFIRNLEKLNYTDTEIKGFVNSKV